MNTRTHSRIVRPAVIGLGAALFLAAGLSVPAPSSAAPKSDRNSAALIFDTDIGPDVDDVGAVAVIHDLANRGEVKVLGMACCTSNEWGAPCLDALNTYFRRPDIPIGTYKKPGFLPDSKYAKAVAQEYPNDLRSGGNAPDATELYRKVLSRARDNSVLICATGPLNNLARFLDSPPDKYSHHTGLELARRKVTLLSVMGGRYPEGKEWNFEQDPPAAAHVTSAWPTPIVFSGFEIGAKIKTGGPLVPHAPSDSPVRRAYALYVGEGKERESWDQTAVVAGVRGAESHWRVQGGGRVEVDPKTGANRWISTPDGLHSYLVERDPVPAVKEAIDAMMLAKPAKRHFTKF